MPWKESERIFFYPMTNNNWSANRMKGNLHDVFGFHRLTFAFAEMFSSFGRKSRDLKLVLFMMSSPWVDPHELAAKIWILLDRVSVLRESSLRISTCWISSQIWSQGVLVLISQKIEFLFWAEFVFLLMIEICSWLKKVKKFTFFTL